MPNLWLKLFVFSWDLLLTAGVLCPVPYVWVSENSDRVTDPYFPGWSSLSPFTFPQLELCSKPVATTKVSYPLTKHKVCCSTLAEWSWSERNSSGSCREVRKVSVSPPSLHLGFTPPGSSILSLICYCILFYKGGFKCMCCTNSCVDLFNPIVLVLLLLPERDHASHRFTCFSLDFWNASVHYFQLPWASCDDGFFSWETILMFYEARKCCMEITKQFAS